MSLRDTIARKIGLLLALCTLTCSLLATRALTALAVEAPEDDMTAIESGRDLQDTNELRSGHPQQQPARKNGQQNPANKRNFIELHEQPGQQGQ